MNHAARSLRERRLALWKGPYPSGMAMNREQSQLEDFVLTKQGISAKSKKGNKGHGQNQVA